MALRAALGFAAAFLALALAAEASLRLWPPADLLPYIGDASPATGPFVSDPATGVGYASPDALDRDYRGALARLRTAPPGPPLWLMFGNSFVQADGMLADTAQAALPDRRIVALRRNEPLPVRVAQVRSLLASGIAPARILFVVLPVDVVGVGEQPLATWRATPRGAITYAVGRPPLLDRVGLGALVDSRLGLALWVRANRHQGNPRFDRRAIERTVDPLLADDLARLVGALAEAGRRAGVPISLVLAPSYFQIARDAPFALQDRLGAIAAAAGLHVIDVRAAFAAAADKPGLFVPDRHFSPRGNAILLRAILDALPQAGSVARDG